MDLINASLEVSPTEGWGFLLSPSTGFTNAGAENYNELTTRHEHTQRLKSVHDPLLIKLDNLQGKIVNTTYK